MINRDRGSWEAQLKQAGGSLYDPSDLAGVIRNLSNHASNQNRNLDPKALIDAARATYAQRAGPTFSNGGRGGDLDRNTDGRLDPGWTKTSNDGGGRWTQEPMQQMTSCFPAGTLVATPAGDVPIETVRMGDTVQATPGEIGTVVATLVHAPAPLLVVTLSNERILRVTAEHPIWQSQRNAFVPAGDLAVADVLRGDDGLAVTVMAVGAVSADGPVYNLTIHPQHTYFAEGVWVHNKMYAGPSTQPAFTQPAFTQPAFTQPAFTQPHTNVPAQYDDPITKFLETFAQRRAQERENPAAGSGQALLEEALQRISQQFQSEGFTPGEQETYQTQALDPLERLRSARKQQVLQQLSQRGIPPSSGVAQQMLADVDRQFDAQRATMQANLAGQFGNERVSRQLQGAQMLQQLAGTQNDRLNEGFQYRTVPVNLADRAFGQNMQVFDRAENSAGNAFNRSLSLYDRAEGSANNAYVRSANTYNMAGNPMALAPALLQLQQLQQNRGDNQQEMLGYLLAMLSQGRR